MITLTTDQIERYRAITYQRLPGLSVTQRDEAIEFVNERGFIYFWPIKDITMPSLWAAVVGDRPVADSHDDPGHVTWGWKDELLGERKWYYAKVLRKRATMISLKLAPHFYALSENYGEPEQDYLLQYEDGRMTWEAKTIYETLLSEGAMDTVSLRRTARMTSKASNYPFSRALETLQADFNPACRRCASRCLALCICLRMRAPPLSQPGRPGTIDPAGGCSQDTGWTLFSLRGHGKTPRPDEVIWLASGRFKGRYQRVGRYGRHHRGRPSRRPNR
jgi:hypothetical protein